MFLVEHINQDVTNTPVDCGVEGCVVGDSALVDFSERNFGLAPRIIA